MTDWQSFYGDDVLARDPHQKPKAKALPVKIGLEITEVTTGFFGRVVRWEKSGGMWIVELEDYDACRRSFPLGPGFLLDDEPVILEPAITSSQAAAIAKLRGPVTESGRRITASGSFNVDTTKAGHARIAKTARASRIWVEGKHDAELVEKIWGDDLREVGVAVQLLEGADHLSEVLAAFAPGEGRRAGVLLDHLVTGSKESHLARHALAALPGKDNVLILGHPFIDIWQAVKPRVVGIEAWPEVPRNIDFKRGTLAALGLPHDTDAEVAAAWRAILRRVTSYKDLEPALVGKVEQLIDFVTA